MEQQPLNITPQMLAPFYKRLLNWFVDWVIISIIFTIVINVCNRMADLYGYQSLRFVLPEFGETDTRIYMLFCLVLLLYYGMFESYLKRTPGKYLTGTRVIRFDGSEPTEWSILLRSLLRLIPMEFISFVGPIPLGLHDSLSKTLVVDIYKYEREIQKQQYKNKNSASEI